MVFPVAKQREKNSKENLVFTSTQGVNGNLELSGAQPEEVFSRVLERLWDENKKKEVKKGEAGGCENGACKL